MATIYYIMDLFFFGYITDFLDFIDILIAIAIIFFVVAVPVSLLFTIVRAIKQARTEFASSEFAPKTTHITLIVFILICLLAPFALFFLPSTQNGCIVDLSISWRSILIKYKIEIIVYTLLSDLAILFILSVSALFISWKKHNKRLRAIAKAALALFILAFLLIGLYLSTLSSGFGVKSRDARRIADIRQVQIALELSADAHELPYPRIDGVNALGRWEILRRCLEPVFELPNDPCLGYTPEKQYDYKSLDGETYVLKAILDNQKNIVLENDIDGEILGLWCGKSEKELEYCVVP